MITKLRNSIKGLTLPQIKNKIKGTYKSNLPEQRYFSLDELLARWKNNGVTFQHLCDWVACEKLVMGVRVRDTSNISERVQGEAEGAVIKTTRSIVIAGPESKPPIRTDYLGDDTLLKILTAAPGVKVGAPTTYATLARDKATGTFHLSGGNYYSKEDLVVCLEEVQRMESLFRIGAKSPLLSRPRQASDCYAGVPTKVLFATGFYILLVIGLTMLLLGNWDKLVLNEIGDFLAGVSAPLTVLWLVTQFRQQAQVSARAEQEILDSARRQEESLRWLRVQAETNVAWLDLERERRKAETEPALTLQRGTSIAHSGSDLVQHFDLVNEGARARELKVFVEGMPEIVDPAKPLLTSASLGQEEKRTFSLTAPRETKALQGTVRIVFVKTDGMEDSRAIAIRLHPAKDEAPHSMPGFELLWTSVPC